MRLGVRMKWHVLILTGWWLVAAAWPVPAQSGRQRERPDDKPRTGFELVSTDGGFRVRLPRGFEQPKREDSANGAVITFTSLAANETLCSVAVRTFTRPELKDATPDQVMDAARDALLRPYKGAIEQEDRYIVQGHPARAVFFGGTREDKAIFGRMDFIFAAPRLYQLAVITTFPIELDRDDVQRFFETFTLLEPQGSAKALAFNHQAAVHNDAQAGLPRPLHAGVNNPKLEPQGFGPLVNGRLDNRRHVFRAPEDVDQINFTGNGSEIGIAWTPENHNFHGVDRDDVVAPCEHEPAHAMTGPVRFGRQPDNGNPAAVFQNPGEIVLTLKIGNGNMVGHSSPSWGRRFTAREHPLERKAAARREMLP